MVVSLITLAVCGGMCLWVYYLFKEDFEMAKEEYKKALTEKDRSIESYREFLEFVVKCSDELEEEEKNFVLSSLKETRKSLH